MVNVKKQGQEYMNENCFYTRSDKPGLTPLFSKSIEVPADPRLILGYYDSSKK